MKKILFVSLMILFSSTFLSADDNDLSGAEIYNDNCARCHNPRPIQEFSESEWSVILPHMREKSHLTGKEAATLSRYFKSLKPDAAVSNTRSTSPKSAKNIMVQFGCMGCHSLKGEGGTIGPILDNVVSVKGKNFIIKKLTDPQFNNPASAMPKFPMSQEDMQMIADFLSSKP